MIALYRDLGMQFNVALRIFCVKIIITCRKDTTPAFPGISQPFLVILSYS